MSLKESLTTVDVSIKVTSTYTYILQQQNMW